MIKVGVRVRVKLMMVVLSRCYYVVLVDLFFVGLELFNIVL